MPDRRKRSTAIGACRARGRKGRTAAVQRPLLSMAHPVVLWAYPVLKSSNLSN